MGILLLLLLLVIFYFVVFFDTTDPFTITPFCDADGTCHEKPDQPSPRTVYSARSKQQHDDWWKLHANLNLTAQAYAENRQRFQTSNKKTIPLILLGDSITESWVGTDGGEEEGRTKGVPAVLQEMINTSPIPLDPLVLAIGGDQTQHLLYRLMNGQLLPEYANDMSAVYVVLIGTNNLGSGELPGPTAKGVLAVANYILKHTKGYLLLFHVLPRGDGFRLARICPPRCNSSGLPFSSYMPAVNKVNQLVSDGMKGIEQQEGHRARFVDCNAKFLPSPDSDDNPSRNKDVNPSLMPDLLHPNAAGHRILAECIMDYVKGIQKG